MLSYQSCLSNILNLKLCGTPWVYGLRTPGRGCTGQVRLQIGLLALRSVHIIALLLFGKARCPVYPVALWSVFGRMCKPAASDIHSHCKTIDVDRLPAGTALRGAEKGLVGLHQSSSCLSVFINSVSTVKFPFHSNLTMSRPNDTTKRLNPRKSPTQDRGTSTVKRMENDDVRAIFESLLCGNPPPPNVKFQIVPVGVNGHRLSPPAYEFEGTMRNIDREFASARMQCNL
jgi:hypothetical protein